MTTKPTTATVPEIVSKESWEQEFTLDRAIPSSARIEPAKALLLFSEILALGSPMKVLDAGVGNGRNAIYLAKRGCDVTALDFSEFALHETRRRATESQLIQRVAIVRHSLETPTTFPEGTFDFVLDAYVFCHFLRAEIGRNFWQEMRRITKCGGHLLSIVFSTEDAYYSHLPKDGPSHEFVRDPANGIWKRLYREAEIKDYFSRLFEIKYFTKFEFSDEVLGKSYNRVLFTSVLRKRP